MSLINCPDCKKEISNKAAFCPNCGFRKVNDLAEISLNVSRIWRVILIQFILQVVMGIISYVVISDLLEKLKKLG